MKRIEEIHDPFLSLPGGWDPFMRTFKTNGLVLRTVKYGETSLVVTVFTELFGLQSYLVNGVRLSTKKGSGRANLFQPAALLDLVVYHNELKNLNRIREFKWGILNKNIFSDVIKNAVSLFMVELLTRCLKQPESNSELFHFLEDCLCSLDEGSPAVTANMPLFFALRLLYHFGFPITGNYSTVNSCLDLEEGKFISSVPVHPHYLEGRAASVSAEILRTRIPTELEGIKLNHEMRQQLLQAYETYYALHIHDFGTLRTLPVLREIMR